jgi:C4-dicarboxylate transporter DctM subunit
MPVDVLISLVGGLVFLLAIGVPIAWSMLGSSILCILVVGDLSLSMVAQRVFVGANVYALLAIPAFILAGDLMTKGGVSERLVGFSKSLVGRARGGLTYVSFITSAFFAAISGSSPATTAAVGSIMLPEMEKEGYQTDFSAAVQAVGGTLGIVIPPSISFVVYGNVTGVSTAKLLASGVIPGVLACIALCIYAYFTSKKNNFPMGRIYTTKEKWESFLAASGGLIMPVIILGGIYSGIFTPTESAVVAAFYGLFAGFLIYRELNFKKLVSVLVNSAITVSNIMIIVACAMLFNYLLTYYRITIAITDVILIVADTQAKFFVLVTILLFIVGMFMDATASILVLAPILSPAANTIGIDPIHFGFLFVFMMSIGLATPPFGLCMYVAANLSGQPVVKVAKRILPMTAVQLICIAIFIIVPQLATWLPSIL